MERLAAQADGHERRDTPVVSLLDRIWNMHPECDAQEIVSCALEVQVRHLTLLPVGGGWLLKFLRTLPSCIPEDAPAPVRGRSMLQDDMICSLAMRRASHGTSGDLVYQDTRDVCDIALRHLAPGMVCRIAVRAYEDARRGARHQGA